MIEPIDNLIYESMKSGNKTELNAYKNIKTELWKVLTAKNAPKYSESIYLQVIAKYAKTLEDAILSLNEMPYRGSIRRTGAFANRGYRQIFAKNFTIVYRIDEAKKTVVIVTVRYIPSSF